MLTPSNLSYAFRQFCAENNCDSCCVNDPYRACIRNHPDVQIECDIVWFVYNFLAGRGLLHKNPNNLSKFLVEDDLRNLVASISQMWDVNAIFDNFSSSPINSLRPCQCKFCPQQSECNNHRTSCRLYFALENYKHLFDTIHHAATLRETC